MILRQISSFSLFLKDLRGVISSLEAFASQFISLEADKVRLQEEVRSSSLKLDGAIKKAATARQEVDSLKEELGKLKEKLKEEEASRLAAEARATEKDELLRQSSLCFSVDYCTYGFDSLSVIHFVQFSCRGRRHPCQCFGQDSKQLSGKRCVDDSRLPPAYTGAS
jgi:hypothetical protein